MRSSGQSGTFCLRFLLQEVTFFLRVLPCFKKLTKNLLTLFGSTKYIYIYIYSKNKKNKLFFVCCFCGGGDGGVGEGVVVVGGVKKTTKNALTIKTIKTPVRFYCVFVGLGIVIYVF